MLALLTFLTALVLIHLGSRFARLWHWEDHPGGRKDHAVATPLHGGLAMALALVPAFILLVTTQPVFVGFLGAVALLIVIGIIDDFKPMDPNLRFICQIMVAFIVVVFSDIRLDYFGDLLAVGALTTGSLASLITIVAIVGIINAVNMIDGIDGLCASLMAQVMLWAAGLLWGAGLVTLANFALATCAAILAYLFFNFPWTKKHRAKVFMGDAGSTFLGFIAVTFSIYLSQPPHALAQPVWFLWLFAIPLYDTGQVMWYRYRLGRSLFAADREHTHHILLARGYSKQAVVLILNAVAFSLSSLGWLASISGVPEYWQFALFLLGFIGFTNKIQGLRIIKLA